jgi:predicted homoserine dehydrogenase-like protein
VKCWRICDFQSTRFDSISNDAELILKEAGLNKRIAESNLEKFLERESDIVIVTDKNSEIAANVVFNSIENKKNVINMNAASEALLGDYFKEKSLENKVIYTVGAGDEPAVTLNLINYCKNLGLDVVCAGKGKNNPLNLYANPDDFKGKAQQIGVSPEGITSFVDGTKTMLEMAILSNASGINIDKDGMHGPNINLADLIDNLKPEKDGGLLKTTPAIDYVIGDVAPGVFAIFTSKQESVLKELNYLKMGKGPYFLLYTPYHLGNIEAPLSIKDIAVSNKPTICVKDKIITTVAAISKKDIKAGERLDSIGGYCFAGIALKHDGVKQNDYLPLALAENSIARNDISKGNIIKFSDVAINPDSVLYDLYSVKR